MKQAPEIEQIISRSGAKYMDGLHALREEIAQQRATIPAAEATRVLRDAAQQTRETVPIWLDNASSDPLDQKGADLGSAAVRANRQRSALAGVRAQTRKPPQPAKSEVSSPDARFLTRLGIVLGICCLALLMIVVARWLLAAGTDDTQQTDSTPIPASPISTNAAAADVSTPGTALAQPTLPSVPAAAAQEPTLPPTTMTDPATAEPAPTIGTPRATDVLKQVIQAEAALRTGEFEATMEYGGGAGSAAKLSFDLGGQTQLPRLHMTSIYTSATSTQTVELITIGDQSWQRRAEDPWAAVTGQQAVWEQVQTFLIRAASLEPPETISGTNPVELRWYKADIDAEVTLVVNPSTGVPSQLRQVSRKTDESTVVVYQGWNTPVEITAPAGV